MKKLIVLIVSVLFVISCEYDRVKESKQDVVVPVIKIDTTTKLELFIDGQNYVDFYIYTGVDSAFVACYSYYVDETPNPMNIYLKHGTYMIIAVCNEWNAYNNEVTQCIRHYGFNKMSFYFGETEK